MVRYEYDAWGSHKIIGDEVLGNFNPFRYRSYYYDTETKLYFLQTRYYDAETGRFITIDGIEYIDPETINGLNLYAYCGNNPVMRTDSTGTIPDWLKWLLGGIMFVGAVVLTALTGGALAPLFIGMGVSIVSSGLIQGTITALNGGNFFDGFMAGAADGAFWGGAFALGGAALRTIKLFTKGVVIGETMTRVNAAAKQIGAVTFKAPGKTLINLFGGKNATKIIFNQNRRWINRMVKWGVKITDIGIDSLRYGGRSVFYTMESAATKGYWHLIKMLFH